MDKKIEVRDLRGVTPEELAYKKGLDDGRNELPIGTFIPMDILQAELPANSKLLYALIWALSKQKGFCYATNEYLAKCLNLEARSILTILTPLKKQGFVNIEVERNNTGTWRTIRPIFPFNKENRGGATVNRRGGQRSIGGSKDIQTNIYKQNKKELQGATAPVPPLVQGKFPLKGSQGPDQPRDSESKQIAEIISLFKGVNPSYERLFPNTSQRSAVARLLKKYGFEKVRSMVEALPEIINQKYAPQITTPVQLEVNLGKLIAFVNQERQTKKGKQIIFTTK